jgi:2-keto-4-pentenoate hydratase/2-oxohepta-3-ene-1,7-dioic acid hydratase in catechol pathway
VKPHPRIVLLALLLASLAWTHAAEAQAVTRYVRYEEAGAASYGILEGETIHQIEGDLYTSYRRTGRTASRSAVRLLAPVEPRQMFMIGFNYHSHLGQVGSSPDVAPYPGVFFAMPSSIVHPDEPLIRPSESRNFHYEAELVIVIGREARFVPVERAHEYVFGVTAGNDASERDWQANDLQWARAKSAYGFNALGPTLARGLDYGNLRLEGRLNGEVRQEASTAQLIWGVPDLVSYLSQYFLLLPGDVIYTGTVGVTQPMEPGDVYEVEIEGIGILRNPVVAAER